MELDRRSVLTRAGALTGLATLGMGRATARRPIAALDADDHDEDDDEDQNPTVRVAHASPDAPDVDVYVDGNKVLEGLAFRSVSGRLSLAAGTYTVMITAAGDPDTVAFEGHVSLEADTDYTVAAIGELSEETFRPKFLVDKLRDIPDHVAALRVVHASPDAPAVDVTVDGGTLADGIEFGEGSHYRLAYDGERTVSVRPDSRSDNADPVFQTDLDLLGGAVYTVFAAGYLTPDDEPAHEPFGLVPAVDEPKDDRKEEPAPALVRVAHASPDAPDVDVLVDGNAVLEGVPFGKITDRLSVPPGTYTVTITAAGDPDTVAFEGDVTVEADTAYTVAAIGELSEETFRPKILVDDTEPERGKAKVRVLHASPDAPAVDVTVDDAKATLVDGLAFGDSSGYATVSSGRYELEVRPDSESNDNPFDADFDALLLPGRNYTAIAAGYFTTDDEPADAPFTLLSALDAEPGN